MNCTHELSLPSLGALSDLELKTLSPKIEMTRGRSKSIDISEINKVELDTTELKIKNRQIILKIENQK